MVPGLAVDMIEVGESTGALPAMLNSVAEFFEEDVNTRMTATLSLIEPAIMIVMGTFVAFVADFVISADLFVGGYDRVMCMRAKEKGSDAFSIQENASDPFYGIRAWRRAIRQG